MALIPPFIRALSSSLFLLWEVGIPLLLLCISMFPLVAYAQNATTVIEAIFWISLNSTSTSSVGPPSALLYTMQNDPSTLLGLTAYENEALTAASLTPTVSEILSTQVYDTYVGPPRVFSCAVAETFIDPATGMCTPCVSCANQFQVMPCTSTTAGTCALFCPAGYFQHTGGPAGVLGTCSPCGPGRYSDQANSAACSFCAVDTYSAGIANDLCLSCANGTTAPSSGASICLPVKSVALFKFRFWVRVKGQECVKRVEY